MLDRAYANYKLSPHFAFIDLQYGPDATTYIIYFAKNGRSCSYRLSELDQNFSLDFILWPSRSDPPSELVEFAAEHNKSIDVGFCKLLGGIIGNYNDEQWHSSMADAVVAKAFTRIDAVFDALSSSDISHQISYHILSSTLPSYLMHTLRITLLLFFFLFLIAFCASFALFFTVLVVVPPHLTLSPLIFAVL
eukprot:g17308.t1